MRAPTRDAIGAAKVYPSLEVFVIYFRSPAVSHQIPSTPTINEQTPKPNARAAMLPRRSARERISRAISVAAALIVAWLVADVDAIGVAFPPPPD
jgi:hypothetical protein